MRYLVSLCNLQGGFMHAVPGRSARVHRIPNFEANDLLKFTRAEQVAIQAAERAFGYQPQPGMVVRPRPSSGLGFTLAAIVLAYFVLSAFVVAVRHSFLSPRSPHETGAPITAAIQREPQSQA